MISETEQIKNSQRWINRAGMQTFPYAGREIRPLHMPGKAMIAFEPTGTDLGTYQGDVLVIELNDDTPSNVVRELADNLNNHGQQGFHSSLVEGLNRQHAADEKIGTKPARAHGVSAPSAVRCAGTAMREMPARRPGSLTRPTPPLCRGLP
jgi:hypothetical protein